MTGWHLCIWESLRNHTDGFGIVSCAQAHPSDYHCQRWPGRPFRRNGAYVL